MGHFVGIVIVVLALAIVVVRSKTTHFECPNCNRSFKVSSLRYVITPHAGFSRYVKCPYCNYSGMMVPKSDKNES